MLFLLIPGARGLAHGVGVGVEHGGVALAPEGVPGLDDALVAGRGEPGVEGVDLLRALLAERQGDAVAALGQGVVGVEGADDVETTDRKSVV